MLEMLQKLYLLGKRDRILHLSTNERPLTVLILVKKLVKLLKNITAVIGLVRQ